MNEKMMEPRDVAELSDMTLFRAAVEYRQAHTLLKFSRSELTAMLRSELEDALHVIERELHSRGISFSSDYAW